MPGVLPMALCHPRGVPGGFERRTISPGSILQVKYVPLGWPYSNRMDVSTKPDKYLSGLVLFTGVTHRNVPSSSGTESWRIRKMAE